jgi:hypothetical protein
MTTIACNRSEMAADGRVTDDGDTFPALKIHKINGAIYGAAGLLAASARFIEWATKGEKGKPRLAKDFTGMKLTPEGIFVISGADPTWMRCDSGYFAIGSGKLVALGAMAFGATPLQAVQEAMRWDIYSGGEPTVLSLSEKT